MELDKKTIYYNFLTILSNFNNMNTEKNFDTQLNREEVLSALDYEISSIEKDQTSPGWTKWTFYGGFATLLWLAINEIEKNDFSIINSFLVLILCSVMVDLAEYFIVILKPQNTNLYEKNRIKQFSQQFACSRFGMLGTSIRVSALLGTYYFLHNSSIQFHSYSFIIYYICLLIVLIIILLLSYTGFPTNPRPSMTTWGNCIFYFIVFIPLSIAFYQCYVKIYSIYHLFTISDIRIGLLETVFLWLLPIAMNHSIQYKPLLETLKNIYHDLSFNKIDAVSAIRLADIAIYGMRVEDYFQLDLQNILKYLVVFTSRMIL
jgi:hypothetical protein